MRDILGNFLVIHRQDLAQVFVEDDAARQKELRVVSGLRKLTVSQKVAQPRAITRPVLVERRDGEQIGYVHFFDELPRLRQPLFHQRDLVRVDGILTVGINRNGHPADQIRLQMRILGAEQGVDANNLALPIERFQIVRDRHQVCFGRQLVGGVSPVRVRKGTQLPRFDKRFDFVLHTLEVRLGRVGPIRNGLREFCRGGRIGFERAHNVHPIERVEVIKVDDVILDKLAAFDDITNDLRVERNRNAERVFHRAHRGCRVNGCADAADALRKDPGIARIASFEDDFHPAKHRAGTPRIGYLAAVHLNFDAQMAFDARDGVNCNLCHR